MSSNRMAVLVKAEHRPGPTRPQFDIDSKCWPLSLSLAFVWGLDERMGGWEEWRKGVGEYFYFCEISSRFYVVTT